MYSRERYFEIKQDIINSGLSIKNYFKKMKKSPSTFYNSKSVFDSDCVIKPVFITKVDGQDEVEPLKISGPITIDLECSTNEFIMVNGLKIEGNAEFLKDVLVRLLKESENVQTTG